ncbi:MAG: hypothetical protein JW881_09130 [Spirochaetales bacterium]|nr:hypothetical protein [Spirochaetales bacterium]
MNVIDIITECAAVPSFSTMEDRLHPLIEGFARSMPGAVLTRVPENNLLLTLPGAQDAPPLALTAHLDKINHFGHPIPENLPVTSDGEKIKGQLDDAAGVGICLYMGLLTASNNFPPLYLLFSEMEEYGPYEIPGEGMWSSGVGAFRLSRHLIQTKRYPALVITIDTTPTFKGKHGVALYSRFWELCGLHPSRKLVAVTEQIERLVFSIVPEVRHENNTNDYVTYGKCFAVSAHDPLPSVALEPAIHPCHTKGEEIFIRDIYTVTILLTELLKRCAVNFPYKPS